MKGYCSRTTVRSPPFDLPGDFLDISRGRYYCVQTTCYCKVSSDKAFHTEKRELSVYAIGIGKNGPSGVKMTVNTTSGLRMPLEVSAE